MHTRTLITDTYKHQGMRHTLVDLVRSKGITNELVLRAIQAVPRHLFMESAFVEQAYQDIAFPIGEGQTISQPYTVAFQTQLLDIKKGDKVLEVGTGSGYQAAVLLELGANLFTIEYNKVLFAKTKSKLPQLGYVPKFFQGDGTLGLPAFAPFQKIIVTAGGPVIPDNLLQQLTIGGVLVIPVGSDKSQTMLRIVRTGEQQFSKEQHGAFAFVKLKGEEGWK